MLMENLVFLVWGLVCVSLPFSICIYGADPVIVHHTLLWLWCCDPLYVLYLHHVFLKQTREHRCINIKLFIPSQSSPDSRIYKWSGKTSFLHSTQSLSHWKHPVPH